MFIFDSLAWFRTDDVATTILGDSWEHNVGLLDIVPENCNFVDPVWTNCRERCVTSFGQCDTIMTHPCIHQHESSYQGTF